MSNCALDFAFANEEEAFAIIETTCGTLKVPTANDRIFTVGPVDFGQEREFKPDEQIRPTPSRFSDIKARLTPGEWSFNSYIKPSGTVGTAPEHDALFQGLMGGSFGLDTQYKYKLANQLDSLSLWVKKGHTVFAFRGTTVNMAEFGVSGEDIAGVAWSGQYMEEVRAGTARTNGSLTNGDVDIPVTLSVAQLYSVGAYITIGDDTTSHRITKVNPDGGLLTITPGVVGNQDSGVGIEPWWPTAGAEVGEPAHGKMGMVTINGEEAVIISAGVTITNNIKYYENEKNNLWTAERFGRPKFREVGGELELHFIEQGPSYWYRADNQIQDALIIPVGNVAGYIMQLYIPYAEYRTPKISGDEEFTQNIPYVAVASASMNDEIEIRFV